MQAIVPIQNYTTLYVFYFIWMLNLEAPHKIHDLGVPWLNGILLAVQ